MTSTTIQVKGTHCVACKKLIESVLGDVAGVTSSNVNYETGEVVVLHDGSVDWQNVKKEIEGLGDYKVELIK